MRYRLWLSILSVIFTVSLTANVSAEKWELPDIGKMEVPPHVHFEEGEQSALPFLQDKGIKLYFTRKGAVSGRYYTMTYSNPPDFSYGWATSQKLGVPFLLEIGEITHKTDSIEKQMDIIAGHLNKCIMESGAVYTGKTLLVRINDKKNPRWEGSFEIRIKEKDIVYHEAYQVVLQNDGYFISLGIINSDAEQFELTSSLREMMGKRKIVKQKKLLDLKK